MLRVLMDKVDSTQEQMGNVSREMEILNKNQVHGACCKAKLFVCFKCLSTICVVNFLSRSSEKPRAMSFYTNTSTSILWSQEESPTFTTTVDQKTHTSILWGLV